MDVAMVAGVATSMVMPFVLAARGYRAPVGQFDELVARGQWRAARRLSRGACRRLRFARLCGGRRWYGRRSVELTAWQERAGAAAAAEKQGR